MRIALFGGTGFVGSYLVDALLEAGMHPVMMVRPGSREKVERGEECTLIEGEIDDRTAVGETLEEADAAVYLIGILREFPDRGITYETLHFEGARRVMNAASALGVRRFLYMSANGVKPDGTGYQRTKYMAEQYLETTDLDWTVFRPSVMFGDPRGRMEFATQLYREVISLPLPAPLFYPGLLPFGAGEFRMSPVHVADVAQAYVAALRKPETAGAVLPLGGSRSLTWREILATIAAAAGRSKLMVPTPAWAVSVAAGLLERYPDFPLTRDQLRMLLEGNTCSDESLRALGITPRPFDLDTLSYLTRSEAAE